MSHAMDILFPWRRYIPAGSERQMTAEESTRAAALARAVIEAEAADASDAPNYLGILMGYVKRQPNGRAPTITDIEAETWAERIKVEAYAARRAQARHGGHRYTIDDLVRLRTRYEDASEYMRLGRISGATFDAYCYAFRDGAFKYTDVGRWNALEHARRMALPLPLSDCSQAERDRRRDGEQEKRTMTMRQRIIVTARELAATCGDCAPDDIGRDCCWAEATRIVTKGVTG